MFPLSFLPQMDGRLRKRETDGYMEQADQSLVHSDMATTGETGSLSVGRAVHTTKLQAVG
jgi:hypothetical protein